MIRLFRRKLSKTSLTRKAAKRDIMDAFMGSPPEFFWPIQGANRIKPYDWARDGDR